MKHAYCSHDGTYTWISLIQYCHTSLSLKKYYLKSLCCHLVMGRTMNNNKQNIFWLLCFLQDLYRTRLKCCHIVTLRHSILSVLVLAIRSSSKCGLHFAPSNTCFVVSLLSKPTPMSITTPIVESLKKILKIHSVMRNILFNYKIFKI